VRHHIVVGHGCSDESARRRSPDRQAAAEAEADCADALARDAVEREEVLGGAAHVLLGLLHRQRHHPLLRLVRLGRRVLTVEVRGEREEPGGRQTVADRPNMVVKPPPLL
jgi:hypothetical protein